MVTEPKAHYLVSQMQEIPAAAANGKQILSISTEQVSSSLTGKVKKFMITTRAQCLLIFQQEVVVL
jgi:hypothetical protein